MATYKEIKGTNIEVLESDPSNAVEGQIWFNSTDQVLKGDAGTPVLVWTTTNPMNSGRYGLGSAGTQTSALGFGGNGPSPGQTAATESWNGTNWTEVNDLNLARHYVAGAGVSNTSALAFGGNAPPQTANTETWNGSNWTEVNNLNEVKELLGGSGTQTSALAYGGARPGGYSTLASTEIWNGSNWTEVNNLNTGRNGLSGAGADSTSAVAFGGVPSPSPAGLDITELWNGTNWTEVNDLNLARVYIGSAGIATAALAIGAQPSPQGQTESWNGTNWTEVNDLNVGRAGSLGGAGTNTLALAFGGSSRTTASEAWTEAGGTVTFTDS